MIINLSIFVPDNIRADALANTLEEVACNAGIAILTGLFNPAELDQQLNLPPKEAVEYTAVLYRSE
jgi:hypothetical protein